MNGYRLVIALACGLCLTPSSPTDTKSIVVVRPIESNAVAIVNGEIISRESYQKRLKELSGPGGAPLSITRKEAVLEEMIRYEAVYAKARAAKFEEEPEVARFIKDLIVSRFIERQMGGADPRITDEQIQDYYTDHRADFLIPASARGAVILLRASAKMEPAKREELKQRAQLAWKEARQAQSDVEFAHLVQGTSEHQATRYRGGDPGWLTREQCDAAFGPGVTAALFALSESNEFAPLVETSEGFYIVKLRARQEARPRPVAEVEDVIRYRLFREHQFQREEIFHARMKQGLDIQINRTLLDLIAIPTSHQEPPALPGPGAPQTIAIR